MRNTFILFMIGVLLLGVAASIYLIIQQEDSKKSVPSTPVVEKRIPDHEKEPETEMGRERIEPETVAIATEDEETAAPDFPALEEPGWHVWGTVIGSDGEVLAGAEVTVYYALDFDSSELASPVYSDTSGIYRVSVPLPDVFLESFPSSNPYPGTIEGRAWIAGYLPEFSDLNKVALPNPFDKNGTVRLDLTLMRGSTLRGRVFDSDANPVFDAEVMIRKDNDRRWDDSHYTDRAGRYIIPIRKAGYHFLRAVRFNAGTARAGPIDLDPGRDMEGPDLYLQGPGELAGAAVYKNGIPAGNLDVLAYEERFIGKVLSGFGTSYSAEHMIEGKLGLPFSLVTTDGGGRFRFTGLEQGRYFLGLDYWEMERKKNPDLYETGRSDIRLVVDQHRLQVVLKDDQGYLIPLAWLQVKTARFDGMASIVGGISEWYLINPGPVAVSASWKDLRASKDLNIQEGQYETCVELIFDEPPEPGILLIMAKGYDGKPVHRLKVDFIHRSSGRFETSERSKGEDGLFRIPGPPGIFDLEISEWAFLDSGNGYLAVEVKNVEVVSGRETSLQVKMPQGGFVRLTVHLPRDDAEEKAPIIHYRLKEPEGQILFGQPNEEGGYSISSAITPGVPWAVWKPLEPGSYCLEITSKGYEPAEVHFTITPGQTTVREVLLLPK